MSCLLQSKQAAQQGARRIAGCKLEAIHVGRDHAHEVVRALAGAVLLFGVFGVQRVSLGASKALLA